MDADHDFCVFAYGSLIWNPGFAYESREPATLQGYQRRYCIRSTLYRGTPDAPGLLLGLERGGFCEGVAYRVAGALHEPTLRYLRERELITPCYDETTVSIQTRDGAEGEALTYVANTDHEEYVAGLGFEETVEIIAAAHGVSGSNADYALNTWDHLVSLGIHDPLLEQVAVALRHRA